ncbi:MAG: TIM barrel protein [Clostridia bacterium]|nr:TIM barrel protein [Clostridia bacterium]
MRLSVCIPMFFRDVSPAQAVEHISALGFDAAEVWRLRAEDTEPFGEALSRHGVTLTGMCTGCFEMTDPARRNEFIEKLDAACETARRLGCTNLITQSGKDSGASREAQLDSMRGTAAAALPLLETHGIRLLLEPLNTRIDHKDAFLGASADAFALVREFNSPYFSVLYDIYHARIMGEDCGAVIRGHAVHIGHLHLAGTNGRHEFRESDPDYPELLRTAEAAGYRGFCGLEYAPLLPREESLALAKKILR